MGLLNYSINIALKPNCETGYTYFGARYYDSELSVWLSVDPLASKYPSMSAFMYVAGNPVMLVDPDGREFDLSNLTTEQRKEYDKKISRLSENSMFFYYYNRLSKSDVKYTITFGNGGNGGGFFNPNNNEIQISDSYEVYAQEIFHAFQQDFGIYTSADKSVRETEGDLVSCVVALSIGEVSENNDAWDQGIVLDYTDSEFNYTDEVFTSTFDNTFSSAVDSRIEYYKKQVSSGERSPDPTYTQENSGQKALALKKALREAKANELNLVGPRLQNGDFYPE